MKSQYRFANYGNQIIHAVRRCSSSPWQLRFLILPFNPRWTYPFIKKYMLAHYFIHELLATWLHQHPPCRLAELSEGNLGFRRSMQIGHFSRHSFTQTHLAVRFLLLHKTRSRPRSHLPPITRGRVISFLFRHIATLTSVLHACLATKLDKSQWNWYGCVRVRGNPNFPHAQITDFCNPATQIILPFNMKFVAVFGMVLYLIIKSQYKTKFGK